MTPISKFFIFLFILTLAIVAVKPIVKRLRSTLTRLVFCIRIMKRLNLCPVSWLWFSLFIFYKPFNSIMKRLNHLKRAGGNNQIKRLDKNENACYNDSSKII